MKMFKRLFTAAIASVVLMTGVVTTQNVSANEVVENSKVTTVEVKSQTEENNDEITVQTEANEVNVRAKKGRGDDDPDLTEELSYETVHGLLGNDYVRYWDDAGFDFPAMNAVMEYRTWKRKMDYMDFSSVADYVNSAGRYREYALAKKTKRYNDGKNLIVLNRAKDIIMFAPGSTGRTTPNNNNERKAMEQARNNPKNAEKYNTVMKDPRWPAEDGWVKMGRDDYGPNKDVEIHFVYNKSLKVYEDFKFKD
ncbi:hypothetical protein A616_23700 [Brevibacillus brevis X23]|nr:hypothetical protein A616_23700 [Brevibacillus brevis X23]